MVESHGGPTAGRRGGGSWCRTTVAVVESHGWGGGAGLGWGCGGVSVGSGGLLPSDRRVIGGPACLHGPLPSPTSSALVTEWCAIPSSASSASAGASANDSSSSDCWCRCIAVCIEFARRRRRSKPRCSRSVPRASDVGDHGLCRRPTLGTAANGQRLDDRRAHRPLRLVAGRPHDQVPAMQPARRVGHRAPARWDQRRQPTASVVRSCDGARRPRSRVGGRAGPRPPMVHHPDDPCGGPPARPSGTPGIRGSPASSVAGRPGSGPPTAHLEVRLFDGLRAADVGGLVRQHRLELPGGWAIHADIAVPELRWAIPIDHVRGTVVVSTRNATSRTTVRRG